MIWTNIASGELRLTKDLASYDPVWEPLSLTYFPDAHLDKLEAVLHYSTAKNVYYRDIDSLVSSPGGVGYCRRILVRQEFHNRPEFIAAKTLLKLDGQ